MHIRIEDNVLLRLQTIGVLNRGAEYSGFGWCRIEGKEIVVYDFILLDLGSEVWTEIPPEVILPLMEREDRQNMKVWLHAHPVGNGIPGPHNWSGTDHDTCTKEPMGGSPQLVGWSVAVVRTPNGFVGRIDNHITKKTAHLEVFPKLDAVYAEVAGVKERKAKEARKQRVDAISRRFSDEDLFLLDGMERETLEDWLAEYLDEEEIEGLDEQPWYYNDEAEGFGGYRWTTQDTSTYSGRKI